MATGISKKHWQKESWQVDIAPNSYTTVFLSYDGKEDEKSILQTKPAEVITLWPEHQVLEPQNRLYYGDNLPILSSLLQDTRVRGKVRLIYIDPPFATNSVFQTRSQANAYSDLLAGAHFIEFLRKRLVLLRELLAEDGSIYVHLDENMAFHIKIIMDEVFGSNNFRNWITRKKCNPKNYTRKTYGNVSDFILFYTKSDNYVWHRPVDKWLPEQAMKEYQYIEKETGRRYKKVPIHAPGIRNGETGKPWKGMLPPDGKHWQYTPNKLDEMDARGEIYWSATGNPRRKIYLDESNGIPIQDIWLEFRDAHNQNIKISGYPTEKNSDMLKRIIEASSKPGDLVLDCFCGSGTTLEVASEIGRKWIGIDKSQEAISTVMRRFALGTKPMGDFVNKKTEDTYKTLSLFESLEEISTRKAPATNKKVIKDFMLFSTAVDSTDLSSIIKEWNKNIGHTPALTLVKEDHAEYSQAYLLKKAVKHLSKVDALMANLISNIGDCGLEKKIEGFEALTEAIIKQQLSRSAANSIMRRIFELTKGKKLTPKLLTKLSDIELQKAGVSARKVSFLRSLQQNVSDGILDFSKLRNLSDEEVITSLTQVKGIGRWTAEMYLIFVLMRPDVFPLDDVALQASFCQLYGLEKERFLSDGQKIADKWRPYRSIACWYLWARLNDIRANKV